MADEEQWVKTLADGRQVKFSYQQWSVEGAFITAQIAGNEVVYSVSGGPAAPAFRNKRMCAATGATMHAGMKKRGRQKIAKWSGCHSSCVHL